MYFYIAAKTNFLSLIFFSRRKTIEFEKVFQAYVRIKQPQTWLQVELIFSLTNITNGSKIEVCINNTKRNIIQHDQAYKEITFPIEWEEVT